MKELVRRVRQVCSEGTLGIASCRKNRHSGRKVIRPLDVCIGCLGAGYAAYQVTHEIVTSGRIPKVHIPTPVKP
jgi:hypothetical protein